jgi:hypothetical protein
MKRDRPLKSQKIDDSFSTNLEDAVKMALDQIQARKYSNQYQLKAATIIEVDLAVGGRSETLAVMRKVKS